MVDELLRQVGRRMVDEAAALDAVQDHSNEDKEELQRRFAGVISNLEREVSSRVVALALANALLFTIASDPDEKW
jgi:hypothetical protein